MFNRELITCGASCGGAASMRKLSRPSSGAVAIDCGSTRSLQPVSSSSLVRMGSSRASAGESSPAGLRTTVGSGFAHGGFSHGMSWACEARGRDGERKRARREGAGAGTGAGVGSGEALAAGKGGLDLGADEAGADFGSGRKAKAEAEAEAAEKGVVSAGASASRSQRGAEKVSCRLGSSTQLSGECSGVTV